MACTFQATIGGKFAPLTGLSHEDMDMDTMITTYNTAVTDAASLKKTRKPNQPRLRFDREKLRDPDVACTFQATIGGKFAPLIGLSHEDMDMDTIITTYNTAVTDAASEILGKERRRKKPWVTKMFSTSVMRGEI